MEGDALSGSDSRACLFYARRGHAVVRDIVSESGDFGCFPAGQYEAQEKQYIGKGSRRTHFLAVPHLLPIQVGGDETSRSKLSHPDRPPPLGCSSGETGSKGVYLRERLQFQRGLSAWSGGAVLVSLEARGIASSLSCGHDHGSGRLAAIIRVAGPQAIQRVLAWPWSFVPGRCRPKSLLLEGYRIE